MRLLLLFCFLAWLQVASFGQNTFVKTFAHAQAGNQVRIVPTPDDGFVVFTLDSLTLYKFNACGVAQWARQYQLPLAGWNLNDFIRTQNGGFAFMSRVPAGNLTALFVLTLDADGNIIWARTFNDPEYNMYPYSLSQDQDGNFVVNANIDHFSTSPHRNLICKISPAGNMLWAKRYEYGPIWGRSIVTSDNGILNRVGSTFVKTDADGNPLWASRVSAQSDYYYAPVEVADGYVLTSFLTGQNKISFQKLDKQGNLLWGHSKEMSVAGPPPLLRSTANGNIAAVINHTIGSKKYAALFEFDAGLNIVRQSALALPGSSSPLSGSDVRFAPDGTPYLAGMVTGQASGLFFAKLDNQYKSGCDTSLAVGVLAAPVSLISYTPAWEPFALQAAPTSVSAVDLALPQAQFACSTLPPLALTLSGDTLLCAGGTGTLEATNTAGFDSFEWSNGQTTASIQVTQPGTYWLRATNSCRAEFVTDSVVVTAAEFPEVPVITDTVLCSTQPVVLNAEVPGATYLWSDNSTNPTFAAHLPGTYTVKISWQGCVKEFSTEIADCESLLMPNVFTPNADNRNDRFEPKEMDGLTAATLTVYNRWGQPVHSSQRLETLFWNGQSEGKPAPAGLYFWHIAYTNYRNQTKELRGMVELLGN